MIRQIDAAYLVIGRRRDATVCVYLCDSERELHNQLRALSLRGIPARGGLAGRVLDELAIAAPSKPSARKEVSCRRAKSRTV